MFFFLFFYPRRRVRRPIGEMPGTIFLGTNVPYDKALEPEPASPAWITRSGRTDPPENPGFQPASAMTHRGYRPRPHRRTRAVGGSIREPPNPAHVPMALRSPNRSNLSAALQGEGVLRDSPLKSPFHRVDIGVVDPAGHPTPASSRI